MRTVIRFLLRWRVLIALLILPVIWPVYRVRCWLAGVSPLPIGWRYLWRSTWSLKF